jgi:hypothetical protein
MRLFLILTFISIVQVSAQENTETTKKEEVEISNTDNKSTTEKRKEEETPDTFDPTEKLSEDIPVDFPVDI